MLQNGFRPTFNLLTKIMTTFKFHTLNWATPINNSFTPTLWDKWLAIADSQNPFCHQTAKAA